MAKKRVLGAQTQAIHAGYPWGDRQSSSVPIFQTVAFHFKDTDNAANIFSGEEEGFVYSRINNPTVDVLERRMATLEGAEAGLCTATGMAAIFMTVIHLAECSDEFISGNRVYGGTFHLFNDTLKKFGIGVRWVKDIKHITAWESQITEKTKFIYAETPGNPTNEIVDIKKLAKLARKYKIPLIIDNTICTPALQNPIKLGADIVIHSLTKYVCGFGSTLGGVLLGKKDFIDKVRSEGSRDIGASLQAIDAWLLLQGLETLYIRMERHTENALKVAKFLEIHKKVTKVHYVGLRSHSQHRLAKKQMKGASSLFSFELKGSLKSGAQFINSLDLIGHMANLGDVKTMAIHPASTTHEQLGEVERNKIGITDTMLRISVGLEDVEDIIEDIERALKKVK